MRNLALSVQTGPAALAVGAHPDDVEFMMSGTILALRAKGVTPHVWSMTDGSLGSCSACHGRHRCSGTTPADELAGIRLEESRASAARAGAVLHEPVARDLELSCEQGLVRKAASVIRLVQPCIILVPSPYDYHPDHRAAAEIAVVAAFARSIPAFVADPPRETVPQHQQNSCHGQESHPHAEVKQSGSHGGGKANALVGRPVRVSGLSTARHTAPTASCRPARLSRES